MTSAVSRHTKIQVTDTDQLYGIEERYRRIPLGSIEQLASDPDAFRDRWQNAWIDEDNDEQIRDYDGEIDQRCRDETATSHRGARTGQSCARDDGQDLGPPREQNPIWGFAYWDQGTADFDSRGRKTGW